MASLDMPARFGVLQSAVEALQCQQQALAEDVQQRNRRPVATMCHVPTQVSPPPAPPLRVAASAQVTSPMLTVLRTRVSAGTQMTPQIQHGINGQPSRIVAHIHDANPEVKRTEQNTSQSKLTPPRVRQETSMTTSGINDTVEPSHLQGAHHRVSSCQKAKKKARSRSRTVPGDGTSHQAWARASEQLLSNVTNTRRNKRQPREDATIVGKENVLLAGKAVPLSRRSKLKRSEQVRKAT